MSFSDWGGTGESYLIRQCASDSCRFRYPVPSGAQDSDKCPICHGQALIASQQFTGRSISHPTRTFDSPPLEVLLDNIRSCYNVGSIIRTCDGAGVGHAHLCGITPTPDHPKVGKTALGADKSVTWSYHRNGLDEVLRLKAAGKKIWSLENRVLSSSIFDCSPTTVEGPVVLVVGNEVSGVDPGILEASDKIFSLPMLGHKSSLNAVVAFGAAVYWLRFGVTLSFARP